LDADADLDAAEEVEGGAVLEADMDAACDDA
jgi:hypothetical protein